MLRSNGNIVLCKQKIGTRVKGSYLVLGGKGTWQENILGYLYPF